jgi:hypothetical protein
LDFPLSISDFGYKYLAVRIFSNNIEIYPDARLIIKNVIENISNGKEIECFLISGVVNIKLLLNDKDLSDIDYGTNFAFPLLTGPGSDYIFNDDFNRGWIFTYYNRGLPLNSQLFLETLYPDFYAGFIFKKIFDSIGIDFEFEEEPALFKKLLLIYGDKTRPIIEPNFALRNSGKVNYAPIRFYNSVNNLDGDNIFRCNAVGDITTNTPNINFKISGPPGDMQVMYDASETALYEIKLKFDGISYYSFANTYLYFGWQIPYAGPNKILSPLTNVNTTYEYTFKMVLPKSSIIGQLFSLRVGVNVGSFFSIGISNISMEINVVDDQRYFKGVFDMRYFLPKLKCWDFIKEICIRLGVVPKFDLFKNKVIFYKFDRLFTYSRKQSISNKVDYSKEIYTKFVLDNYAQINNFSNKESDDVPTDKASLLVSNETIELNKDFYNSTFALPDLMFFFTIPIIRVATKNFETTDLFDYKLYKITDSNLTVFRFAELPATTLPVFMSILVDVNRETSPAVSTSTPFIPTFENLKWANILNNSYSALSKLLYKPQIKVAYLWLNENDINNFDFLKPIFIEEFQNWYFIYKIEQFESSDIPVRCEMLRLTDVEMLTDDFNVGNGVKFDGVSHYVTIPCPLNSTLDFDYNQDFSFSVIVKPNLTELLNTSDRGINRIQGSDIKGYDILFMQMIPNVYTLGIILWGNGTKYIRFDDILSEDIRHYVFVKETENANNWKIYKNGILLSTTMMNNQTINQTIKSNKSININRQGSVVSKNIIYDLKGFNKALTQTEVTELYNTKGIRIPSTAQTNLVLDLRMEEKTGTNLADSSGNGNNGTMVNYTLSQVSLGSNNHHVDKNGDPILS